MGTHSTKRRNTWALAIVAACLATTAGAGDGWIPMLPDQDFYDLQLFAPPDLQDYEIYREPSEGFFFNYDRLYWAITPPQTTGVAETDRGGYLIPSQPISPQAIVQLNNGGIVGSGTAGGSVIGGIFLFGADPLRLDLNTSWMRTGMTWGNRYEGGWVYDDRGIEIGYFNTGSLSQSFQTNSEFAASSPTQIFTQNVAGGGLAVGGGIAAQPLIVTTITSNSPPPDHLIAQKLVQTNSTEMQSAAVAFLVRRELGRRGSGRTARFSVGPRYMQFAESFNIQYESNQYAFNQGPTGSTQGGGVNVGIGPGVLGGGGGAAGGAGGAAGGVGGGAAGGGAGGAAGGLGTLGGANTAVSVLQTSAGDVLGIGGYDTLTGLGPSSPLQTGQWVTNTYNNMVGPEFAMLLESTHGRWTFSSEFKFVAAFNWQNNLYRGANFPESIGADYLRATFNPSVTQTSGGTTPVTALQPPPLFLQLYGVGQSNATNAAKHEFVFSPIGEWRLGTQFRVSNAILLRAGYTGMWLSNIARASSNTGYTAVEKRNQYAEPRNPTTDPSTTNPWVVKTTGPPPPEAVPVPGSPNTFKTPNGMYYTGVESSYYRQNPVYNRIGPDVHASEYVFTNGVDFGIEIKY